MAEQGRHHSLREPLTYYAEVNLHERIRARLQGSGFEHMFEVNSKANHVQALLQALFDAYDVQTQTFQIGQTQIYFGLEDVLMITGLPIDGKPLIVNDEVTNDDCQRLIGLRPEKENSPYIKLTTLKEFNNESNDETLDQACRATSLLGIGCMVQQDIGKHHIHTKYVNLLRDVNDIKSYAWGAASWVNLLTCIKQLKINPNRSGISGCTFALMVFAFIRIPNIISHCYKQRIQHEDIELKFPLRLKCIELIGGAPSFDGFNNPDPDLLSKILSQQTAEDIIWKPYTELNLNEPYLSQKVMGRSVTTVIVGPNAMNHRPDLVHHQLLEGELNTASMELWVGNLAKVPDGRGRTPKYIPTWKKVWETRLEQLISEVPSTTRSSQPGENHNEINVGAVTGSDGDEEEEDHNVENVGENVEDQEMYLDPRSSDERLDDEETDNETTNQNVEEVGENFEDQRIYLRVLAKSLAILARRIPSPVQDSSSPSCQSVENVGENFEDKQMYLKDLAKSLVPLGRRIANNN